jgi:hypothetical protein
VRIQNSSPPEDATTWPHLGSREPRPSSDTKPDDALIWDFSASRTVRNKSLYFTNYPDSNISAEQDKKTETVGDQNMPS